MEGFVGRGRGIHTNVPELELIEEVRLRPLLYDKNVKDYRKPGASELAWKEVADSLQTTVSNCRKRWKSLRDTFIRYYRLDVVNREGSKKNKKDWVYFKNMSFLIPHVELYRLDDSVKVNDLQQHQNESIPVYLKDDYLEEKHIYFAEEDNSEIPVTYQIKISSKEIDCNEEHISESIEDDSILENNYVEERLDESTIDLDEQTVECKVMRNSSNEEHTYMLIEQSADEESENSAKVSHQISRGEHLESASTTTQKNVIDPDERYLLSCLPAFKRLTPQQKGLIRMGIERLFYEVEFPNDYEPNSKKSRND